MTVPTLAMLFERDVSPRRFIRVVALAILVGCFWPVALIVAAVIPDDC